MPCVDLDLSSMKMALDLKFLQPLDYFRKFFEHKVRPDGRSFFKCRPIAINIGSISTADGSSVVKLGDTTVICGIKTEIVEKQSDDKISNFVTTNVDLSPICSPHFRSGFPNEISHVANQFLIDLLTSSKCILPSTLAIPESKYCRSLKCDIMCINLDGNILDAISTALIAALKNVQIPEIKVDSNTEKIKVSRTDKTFLNVSSHPIATSFLIFDDDIILMDPTSDEEAIASSMLTISLLDDDQICHIHKPGGIRISDQNLTKCIAHAKTRAVQVRTSIFKAVQTFEPTSKNLL